MLLCGVYVLVQQHGDAAGSFFGFCGRWFSLHQFSDECGSGTLSYKSTVNIVFQ